MEFKLLDLRNLHIMWETMRYLRPTITVDLPSDAALSEEQTVLR